MDKGTERLIEVFERMKSQNRENLERVERMPGFRMMEFDGKASTDVTETYKRRLRDSIDEWQHAIDYLKRHNV